MKNLFKKVMLFILTITIVSCSNNDEENLQTTTDTNIETPEPAKDTRSFVTDNNTDYFINRDGTVNITVNAAFNNGSTDIGIVTKWGFVYSLTSKENANTNNTMHVSGLNKTTLTATFDNLLKGKTYFIRGFLKMKDDTYFYGNEIPVNTNIDAKDTRKLTLEVTNVLDVSLLGGSPVTPFITITNLTKESPKDIGFQYSLDNNFTKIITILFTDSNFSKGHIYKKGIDANDITPNTKYYFRPYAKYADGTVTNGGTSSISHTTSK